MLWIILKGVLMFYGALFALVIAAGLIGSFFREKPKRHGTLLTRLHKTERQEFVTAEDIRDDLKDTDLPLYTDHSFKN